MKSRRTPLPTINDIGITVSIGCTAKKVSVCIIHIFPDCSSAQTYNSLKSLHHTNQNLTCIKHYQSDVFLRTCQAFFQLFQILRWCVDIVIVLCMLRPCFHFLSLWIHLWLSPAPLSYCCYFRQTSSGLWFGISMAYAVTALPAEMLSKQQIKCLIEVGKRDLCFWRLYSRHMKRKKQQGIQIEAKA